MRLTDLVLCLCGNCVRSVKRCCAAQDAGEMKEDKS